MSSPAATYDQVAYTAWHEQEISSDALLYERLAELRNDLVRYAPAMFTQFGQLLSQIARVRQG